MEYCQDQTKNGKCRIPTNAWCVKGDGTNDTYRDFDDMREHLMSFVDNYHGPLLLFYFDRVPKTKKRRIINKWRKNLENWKREVIL